MDSGNSRVHRDTRCDDELKRQLGADAGLIAEVVPAIWSGFPDLPEQADDTDSERARFRLFDATGQFLKRAAPANSFWIALMGISVVGFALPIHGGPTGAIWQRVIPNAMQGRFFSLTGSIMGLLGPITLAIARPIAERYGVRLFSIVHPIGALLVATIRFAIPSVRNLERSGRSASMPVRIRSGELIKKRRERQRDE